MRTLPTGRAVGRHVEFHTTTDPEGDAVGLSVTANDIARVHQALLPPGSISDQAACVAAVRRLGFVWAFTPGAGTLPAIFTAMACETEYQKWDLMWGWKDRIAESRQAYYGKLVCLKPTFVSMEWLPRFYALTGNTGDLADDLDQLGENGRVPELARNVVNYLSEHGPTGTRTLMQKLTDGSKEMKSALEKALEFLDTRMLIVKAGTEGGNSIANVWDLFPRFLPDVVDAGTEIPTREAAVLLFRQFFQLTPAATVKALDRLFPWNPGHQKNAIARLVEAGELVACTVNGKPGLRRADFGG